MCLYDKVRRLCDKKKVTIYKMCQDTGIKQNTVSNWKDRPTAVPSLEIALKMSSYFNVSADYFIKN